MIPDTRHQTTESQATCKGLDTKQKGYQATCTGPDTKQKDTKPLGQDQTPILQGVGFLHHTDRAFIHRSPPLIWLYKKRKLSAVS